MIEKIFIPTIKRPHKQFTFENLPPELQSRVIMVIDPSEASQYKYDCEYLHLPDHILGSWTQLAQTRKFIHEKASGIKYAMIDDDLIVVKRNAKYWTGVSDMEKSKRIATQEEILRLFETASMWLDQGDIGIVGLSDGMAPPAAKEYLDTKGVFAYLFCDGKKLDRIVNDLDTSIRVAEDVQFMFECLDAGINTRMSNEFLYTNKSATKELESSRPIWEDMFDEMPKCHFQTDEHYEALAHIQRSFPHAIELFTTPDGQRKNRKSWKKAYRPRRGLQDFL